VPTASRTTAKNANTFVMFSVLLDRNGFRSFEHVGYRSTGAAAAAAATAAAFAEALIACAATRRARARTT